MIQITPQMRILVAVEPVTAAPPTLGSPFIKNQP